MRKTVMVLPFMLLLLLPTFPLTSGETEKVCVVIVFNGLPDAALIHAHGGEVKYQYNIIPGISAYLPVKAVQALEKNPAIDYIEYDVTFSLNKKPADPGGNGKGKGKQKATVVLSTDGPGTTDPTPGTYMVKIGRVFNALAIPDTGATFLHWLVTPEGYSPYYVYDPNLSAILDVNTAIVAFFELDDVPPPPPPPPSGQTLPWGVDRIDAEKTWNTATGMPTWVAILDTGIDRDHPDLIGNIIGGRNFVPDFWLMPPDPTKWDDDHGHGTWCAGIIAAMDNNFGVVGVAPEAYLFGVKVLDSAGSGQLTDIIAGIDWCVQNGMDVISMSFAGTSDMMSLEQAINNAYAAGLVIVAAAGNGGDGDPNTDDVAYPAKYYGAIAVAATAPDDSSPTFSAEGPDVELAAPGVAINSTSLDGGYEVHDGTSGACPHVTGTAALLLSMSIPPELDSNLSGDWEPIEVRLHLRNTADDLGASGFDYHFGYGLVDAEEAVMGSES